MAALYESESSLVKSHLAWSVDEGCHMSVASAAALCERESESSIMDRAAGKARVRVVGNGGNGIRHCLLN